MARAGMNELIAGLRGLCGEEGTTDYSDDALQAALDRQRRTITREPLKAQVEYNGGAVVYRDYRFSQPNAEGTASGSAAWRVEDEHGAEIATEAYTVDMNTQTIRFNADTGGVPYVLTYRSYDMTRAAAAIWREKAANAAGRYDVKTDNHDLKASQLMDHCLQMARMFEVMAGARSVKRLRGDQAR